MTTRKFRSTQHQQIGVTQSLRILGAICLSLCVTTSAHALKIAVYGDNQTDDEINSFFGAGSATLVTDTQLATAGFLSAFDAVYITRDGASYGTPLTAGAASRVQSYVGASGNVVLLLGDFSDALGYSGPADINVQKLTRNAVSFAAASGHGYIGEFNGAAMGLAANGDGSIPLGFISGSSAALTCCPADGNVNLTQPAHPVLAGLPNPILDPSDLEYGVSTTGVPNANVIARYAATGDAAVAVRGVPEPATLALLSASAFVGLCWRIRRR